MKQQDTLISTVSTSDVALKQKLTDEKSVSNRVGTEGVSTSLMQIKKANSISTVHPIVKNRLDSLHLNDTLATVDTIVAKKAIRKQYVVLKKIDGREGKSLPSYPQTEPWVFVLILFLFILFVTSVKKSAGRLYEYLKNFFNKKKTAFSYSTFTINLLEYKISSFLLSLGVVSLFISSVFCDATSGFQPMIFLKILAVTFVFYLLKVGLINFIGYVFFSLKQVIFFKETYSNLILSFSLFIFPILIIKIYSSFHSCVIFEYTAVILLVIFYILLLFKVFQIFYTKILDSFYVFLYLCTLEILPLILLLRVYNLII
ncbi:MAG: DUF4271 domain-containing protein [Paludibacteraceae bacterium]